jgi:hypothetical protein
MSSEKFRVLLFLLFLAILVVFGMLYHPANALSQPASHNRSAVQQSPGP